MGLLRIILAITVVIAHSYTVFGFSFTGGLVAVEVFFIISGFYMAMILDEKYAGKGSYALFLSNRFLRLYPLFWVVLLLTIVTSVALYIFTDNFFRLSPYIQYFDSMAIETLLYQIIVNIVLLGQDIVMFLGFSKDSGGMYFTSDFRTSDPMFYKFLLVPQAWTLALEVMFYLIAPFVVRKSNIFIVSLIIFSMLTRAYIYFFLGYTNDPWTYRFFPAELALFLFGVISFRLYKTYKIQKTKLLGRNLVFFIYPSLFLTIIFYQFIPKAGFGHIINWLFYVFCALSLPFIFEFSKAWKLDARIGELSYPIYISHILVIGAITPFMKGGGQEHRGTLAVLFTIIFSYILLRLISDPIEKIRKSRVKHENKPIKRSTDCVSFPINFPQKSSKD